MGVLSHALFLKGVDLDTFFEGSRQMVKIYNFLCTEAKKSLQQLWQVIDSRPLVALLAAEGSITRGRG